jgi:hypothetical protein
VIDKLDNGWRFILTEGNRATISGRDTVGAYRFVYVNGCPLNEQYKSCAMKERKS